MMVEKEYSIEDLACIFDRVKSDDLQIFLSLSMESIVVNDPHLFNDYARTIDENLSEINNMIERIEDPDAVLMVSEYLSYLNKHIAENPLILKNYTDFINGLKSDDEKKYLSSGFVSVLDESPEDLEYFLETLKTRGAPGLNKPLGAYTNIVKGMKEHASRFLNVTPLFSKLSEAPEGHPEDLLEFVYSLSKKQ